MSKAFYCDNCGESVNSGEERCPGCGRFFRAVKCPVCSYSGKGGEFAKGCPVCGYLSDHKHLNQTGSSENNKKGEFLKISKLFAYTSLVLLSFLLIYLIYLFFKI